MCESGGTVGNTLKGGGTEKRGGETKILKREGKLNQGVGALKKRGVRTPLRTMRLCLTTYDSVTIPFPCISYYTKSVWSVFIRKGKDKLN